MSAIISAFQTSKRLCHNDPQWVNVTKRVSAVSLETFEGKLGYQECIEQKITCTCRGSTGSLLIVIFLAIHCSINNSNCKLLKKLNYHLMRQSLYLYEGQENCFDRKCWQDSLP